MEQALETHIAADTSERGPLGSSEAPGCARPILFSGPMVRAVLSGEKTQTRRIYKPASKYDAEPTAIHQDGSGQGWIAWYGPNPPGAEETVKFYPGNEGFKCPYGLVGDRLYVRESWWECVDNNDRIYYAATETPEGTDRRHYRKRPSIHMRRTDSRITLEVVDVRLERLTAISVGDAIAEGVGGTTSITPCYARERFKTLWESINGPCSWDADPLVWVVLFRVV